MSTSSDTTKAAAVGVPLAVGFDGAASMLGVSRRTVETLEAGGHLPSLLIRGRRLFPVDGLRAYVAASTCTPRSGPLAEGGTR